MVNTKGLSRAEVLAALYNASHPQGLGALSARPGDLSIEEAERLAAESTKFEYVYGRVLKVDLSDPDGFEEWLYDRDVGEGAVKNAIQVARDWKCRE